MADFAIAARTLDSRTDHEITTDQVSWYTRVREAHTKYIEEVNKQERFYLGKQWTDEVLAQLAAEGRPALTINMILFLVNTLIGEHARKRANVAFEPIRGGNEGTAGALSKLWADIANRNKYQSEERDVLEDGLILRRGWFDIRMDMSSNVMGDVKIRAVEPREVIIDPDGQKYDPTTWGFLGRTWWSSLNDIAMDYGLNDDQMTVLRALGGTEDDGCAGLDLISFVPTTFGGQENSYWSTTAGEEAGKDSRKLYRLLEREYYVRTNILMLVDPRSGDTRQVPDHWSDEYAQGFAAKHELTLTTRMGKRIRWTVTVGTVVLRDMWSPYRTFTKRPYFPYFRRGNPMGVIDNLISPQEQLNKIASQELHVINTTANSGWMVPKGSLTNMTTDELKAHGSASGVVIEYNGAKGDPKKIQPNSVPSALDRAEQKAQMNLLQISGLQQPDGADPQKTVNGEAVEFVRDRSNLQTQVVMENLARTREMVVEKVLELVQDFMSQERVISATLDMDEPQEVIINQVNDAGEIVNDVTKGEYKAVITMIPSRDTYRENQLIEAMALVQQGAPIRPERLVKMSSLVDREAVAQEVAADLGRGPVTPEQEAQQQFQSQLEMKRMFLMVEELAGKVGELQSRSALNQAKAIEAAQSSDVALTQTEAEVQMARENNALREVLAQLSATAKMDSAQLNALVRTSLQRSKEKAGLVDTLITTQAPKQESSAMTAPPAAAPSSEE